MGDKLALRITSAMATWSFIFVFLGLCVIEIVFNHMGSTTRFHFDPQTIILNLMLSLIAAIQGSIIMIAQRQSDKKLMTLINSIYELEETLEEQEQDELKGIEEIKELVRGLYSDKA